MFTLSSYLLFKHSAWFSIYPSLHPHVDFRLWLYFLQFCAFLVPEHWTFSSHRSCSKSPPCFKVNNYLGFDKCSNTFTSFSKIKILIVLHLVLFNINIFCGILQWYTSLWNKNQKTFILNDDNFEQSCDFWDRQNHTT